jgi:acetyl esterase/lipase
MASAKGRAAGVVGIVMVLLVAAAGASAQTAARLAPYQNIPLWEGSPVPLASGIGPLDQPFLTALLPPEGKANGAAVVIAPGGANIMLMYGGEGLDIAERYNDWGVTAFVLTYRLSPKIGFRVAREP